MTARRRARRRLGLAAWVAAGCAGGPDPVDTDSDPVAHTGVELDTGLERDPCTEDADEPNDELAQALPTTGGQGFAVCGGSPDFWTFTLADGQTGTVTVTFDPAVGDLDVALFDEAGAVVDLSVGSGGFEQVVATNGAGAARGFFIEVHGFAGAQNRYDLALDLDP